MAENNRELARIFEDIADMLEILDEDPYRVNAYRKAARAIRDLNEDVAEIARRGRLESIPGVGKSTAEKIREFLQTGKVSRYEELKAKVPTTLLDLLKIPGMGPKKAAAAWKKLGVTTVEDLKRVLESGELARLPGMGQKSVEQIKQGLAFVERASGRVPLGLARPVALQLAEQVRALKGVRKVELAGSLRRGRETVGDVDILCVADNGAEVISKFVKLPEVKRALAAGGTKGSVIVETPEGSDLQVDLRVVPEESFGAALQYFTGSKEHNVRIREIAIKKGWKLNEYGLFDGERQIAGRQEEQIYKKLGLPWIPPELREDRGEIEAAKNLPKLVELKDIRGDLHVHTTASDGRNTIEEMAKAAKSLGYEYLGIADHSKSQAIANGLSVDRMWEHIEQIRAINRKLKGITLLVSCEVDILANGKLDYPDDLLAACDLVTASIHSGFSQDRKTATRRILSAMENPYVTIIGHPTGRLIGKREPIDLDMEAIVKAAAETNTALEVNAHWQRLDLKDTHIRMAIDQGAMIAICTDAHSTTDLLLMEYGVQTARRGWAEARHVLNARSLTALKQWIRKKRGR